MRGGLAGSACRRSSTSDELGRSALEVVGRHDAWHEIVDPLMLLMPGRRSKERRSVSGSPQLLENRQCIIGATTVSISELSTIIKVDVTFKKAFSGLKNIYMYGADTDGTINTGWVERGTWTPF